MRTNKCKNCARRFRVLTKENLCVFCSFDINKEWPKEFIGGKMSQRHMK